MTFLSSSAAMAEPFVITTPEQLEAMIKRAVSRAVAELQPAAPANDPPPRHLDEMLTVPEGAAEAKCSSKTIRAACASCAIEAHKPAGLEEWRFTRSALLTWLNARANPQPSSQSPAEVDKDKGPRQAIAKINGKLQGVP